MFSARRKQLKCPFENSRLLCCWSSRPVTNKPSRTRRPVDALNESSIDGQASALTATSVEVSTNFFADAHLRDEHACAVIEAIFADGISTKSEVTEISGRGVGMAAVREACSALGGPVDIESQPWQGTSVRCSFPARIMGGHTMASMVARPITPSLAPAII